MNGSEREGVCSVKKRVIGAAIVGWLFLISTVAVSALVFHIFSLPEDWIPWVVGCLTYLAAFLSGFRSAKSARKQGFAKGFWAGAIFVLGYLMVNLITRAPLRLINSLILLIVSVIGGIFGINAQKTKRRR